MKTLILVPIVFLTTACCSLCPVKEKVITVDKEVFVTPKFDMPTRPTVKDYSTMSDKESIRNIQLDFIDFTTYAGQLEELLFGIKNGETINNQ